MNITDKQNHMYYTFVQILSHRTKKALHVKLLQHKCPLGLFIISDGGTSILIRKENIFYSGLQNVNKSTFALCKLNISRCVNDIKYFTHCEQNGPKISGSL